jgi:hypothetical protein
MAMESKESGFDFCFTFSLGSHCLRMPILRLDEHRLFLELRQLAQRHKRGGYSPWLTRLSPIRV